MRLFDQFDLFEPPRLVEPWLQRTIEAKDHPPPFSRNGLYPVACLARRGSWAEVHIIRTVRVLLYILALASKARKAGIGLQFRARLCVVHHDRPERLGWHIWRQMQFVGLRTIQIIFGGIDRCNGILGSDADHLLEHRWRNARIAIKHQRAG